MIDVLAYLTAATATTKPTPPPDAANLHYLINQVEWFYGEMFLGMTVLYGFIAAIFGYFIPQHNLKALHERMDRASADAKNATDAATQATAEIKKQEALAMGVAKLAIATGGYITSVNRSSSEKPREAEPYTAMIGKAIITRAFDDAHTAIKKFAEAANEELFGTALDLAAAILSTYSERLDKDNLKVQCTEIVKLHEKLVTAGKITAHNQIQRFKIWLLNHPNN